MPAESDEQVTATALRNVAEEHPHLAEHIQHHRTGIFPNRTDEFTLILDFILDGLDQAARPSSALTWGR